MMDLENLRETGDGKKDQRYRKKDGTLVDAEEIRTRIPFSGKKGILVIAHDISERKQLEEILLRLSRHDGLTGIANRRHFDEFFQQEWKRALREKTPLSLILCDIDFFKSYNDTYGHQTGGDGLRAVAGVLQRGLRRPGRPGGALRRRGIHRRPSGHPAGRGAGRGGIPSESRGGAGHPP